MDFEGRASTSSTQISYPASFQNVRAACGHTLRPEEVFGHRVSQGRAVEPVLCASCDMLEILGTLYTAEFSSEWIAGECLHRLDPNDNLGPRILDWMQTYTDVLSGTGAREMIGLMLDMEDHDRINLALLESKDRIKTVGILARDEWCEKWGLPWDLASVHVKYGRNADGTFTVKVEVERDPGKECTAENGLWGLPNLGFPQLGSAQTSCVRMGEGLYGRTTLNEIKGGGRSRETRN